MTALEPPSDRVILRPHEPETETAFGLALPETAQGKSQYATVLAVGWGRWVPWDGHQPGDIELNLPRGVADEPGGRLHIPLGGHACPDTMEEPDGVIVEFLCFLRPGDVVLMPAYGGTSMEFDGEEVISILASELLAVVADA